MNYRACWAGGGAGVLTVLLIAAAVNYTGYFRAKAAPPREVHYHQGVPIASPPGYAAGYFNLAANQSVQPALMRSMQPETGMRPIAMIQPMGATLLMQADTMPQLVRKLGMEVLPTESGKVRITGVMEKSRAVRGGLQRGDIILRVNDKRVQGLAQFQTLVQNARNERVAPITVMREGRVKKLLVKIGEGDMDGVGPVMAQGSVLPAAPPAAFAAPGIQGAQQ